MQDRTINNALLALQQQGGPEAYMAHALLLMRGVEIPRRQQYMPLARNQCARLVMDAVKTGPNRLGELADLMCEANPNLTRHNAYNRVFSCVCRLQEKGFVVKKDRVVWLVG